MRVGKGGTGGLLAELMGKGDSATALISRSWIT